MMKLEEERKKQKEHESSDAFVFIMMSHGTQGHIRTSDNQNVNIEKEIEARFDGINCPALEGKPKLFYIQACQEG